MGGEIGGGTGGGFEQNPDKLPKDLYASMAKDVLRPAIDTIFGDTRAQDHAEEILDILTETETDQEIINEE